MKLVIHTAVVSTFLALTAASGALAQAQPQPAGDHRGPRPMAAQMQAMREAHERQHAQDMRTILRLRPDQEPALTAFLQSHKRPTKPPEHRGPPGADAMAMTTPQRLDEMARREAEHSAMRLRHDEALRTFYAALSPEQRQVFDALQRMHGAGRGHGGGHGGWGHHGFGGPRGPMGGPPAGGPPARD